MNDQWENISWSGLLLVTLQQSVINDKSELIDRGLISHSTQKIRHFGDSLLG